MKKKELKLVIKDLEKEIILLQNKLKQSNEENVKLSQNMNNILKNVVCKKEFEMLENNYNQLMWAYQMEAIKSSVYKTEMEKINEKDCCFYEIERVIVQDKKRKVIVVWKDGSKTVAKCAPEDTFDVQTGLMICLARRVYGEVLEEVLLPYTYTPDLVNAMKAYINLEHPDYKVRSEAAKNWEVLKKPMRQSAKAHLENLAKKGLIEEVLEAKVKYC